MAGAASGGGAGQDAGLPRAAWPRRPNRLTPERPNRLTPEHAAFADCALCAYAANEAARDAQDRGIVSRVLTDAMGGVSRRAVPPDNSSI